MFLPELGKQIQGERDLSSNNRIIRISAGSNNRESTVFSTQKIGMVVECNFFHLISNEDKIIGQFSSGVEILGYFSHRGTIFFANFSSGVGIPPGL